MTRETGHTTVLACDVATAWATLTGPGWPQRKADRLHDDSRQVSRTEGQGGAVTIAVSRRLPEGVPGFLKRFLPADGRVVQTDTWGSATVGAVGRDGTWALTAGGVPADMHGRLRVEPAEGGCRYVMEGTVKVNVPLIGGKAESYLADMLGRIMDTEGRLLAELVSEPTPPRAPPR